MPIFKIQNKTLTEIKSGAFSTERELQELVNENLEKIFNIIKQSYQSAPDL